MKKRTKINQSNQKIPKLRFSGFSGEWEEKKLGDVAGIKRGAASQHLKYVDHPDKGVRLLRINDFLNDDAVYVVDTSDMKRFRVKTNDLLIAGTGATAGIIFIVPEKFDNIAFSYNAPRIRIHNANYSFVYLYLKSNLILKQQKRLFVGNAQPFLDTDSMRGFKINLPSLPEQERIADFLGSVDEWIKNLNKQKEVYEDYKKGLMQKIFSQEIRFKNENGSAFPKWEEKRLGEVATFLKGRGISKDEIDENGTNKCIRYGELYTEYNEVINEVVSKTMVSIHESFVGQKNDVLIPSSGETALDIATSSCINIDNVLLGGDLNVIRLNGQSDEFFAYYLSNFQNRNIARLAQGNSVVHLYASHLKSLKINFPSLPEQQKIANFLTSIDNLIESKQLQIAQAKQWKNGLMQEMFV